ISLSCSLLVNPPPPRSTLFPYTTLFRSLNRHSDKDTKFIDFVSIRVVKNRLITFILGRVVKVANKECFFLHYSQNHVHPVSAIIDRKSTRLNSSHVKISYAVFCLKKKTK